MCQNFWWKPREPLRCLTLSYGGRTQAAHKLREIAILVVNWAVERDELETNFLLSRTRSRRHGPASPERTKRSRTFSATEIKAVRTACQSVGRPFADIVRLLFGAMKPLAWSGVSSILSKACG